MPRVEGCTGLALPEGVRIVSLLPNLYVAMRTRFLLGLAVSALLLPACDSDGGGESPALSTGFEVTVTGDERYQFEGIPFAYDFAIVDPQAPSDTLSLSSQISLVGLVGAEQPSITFRVAEELAVGTVGIGSRWESLGGTYATLMKRGGEEVFIAESASGTLTISRADDEGVEGTFRFVTETAYTLPSLPGPFPPTGEEIGEERPYDAVVEGTFAVDRQMQGPPGGGPRPFFPYTPLP